MTLAMGGKPPLEFMLFDAPETAVTRLTFARTICDTEAGNEFTEAFAARDVMVSGTTVDDC